MQPLQITFELATPVVIESEHPIHFDGVLASCVAQEAVESGSRTPWQDADDLSKLLESTSANERGEWVWKASRVLFEPASERFMQSMVRRAEPETFMGAQAEGFLNVRSPRSVFVTTEGAGRAYYLFHNYQWMRRATAWCIGDAVEIMNSLKRVQSLGKLARNGYGVVRAIQVSECEDNGQWRNRFLPLEQAGAAGVAYITGLRRLQAPYWKKEAMTEVLVPL